MNTSLTCVPALLCLQRQMEMAVWEEALHWNVMAVLPHQLTNGSLRPADGVVRRTPLLQPAHCVLCGKFVKNEVNDEQQTKGAGRRKVKRRGKKTANSRVHHGCLLWLSKRTFEGVQYKLNRGPLRTAIFRT